MRPRLYSLLLTHREESMELKLKPADGLTIKKPDGTKLATEALKQMQQSRVSGLLAADENGRLVGALNMHDLLKARII